MLLNSLDRDYVENRLGIPPERTSVIPNGIADHFHRAPPPEDHGAGPIRLAFVGRWTTYKGKEALVDAAVRLSDCEVPFSLSLLGTGPTDAVLRDFPDSLRSLIDVRPAFANTDLPELLADHDVFLFPSLSEGSSASLIEAMACGLAPVATRVGAAPEIVEEGRSGLLVGVGDAEAIAHSVRQLSADRPRLLEMRRWAQEVARGYRWSKVAERTLAVYERALAARSTAETKRGPTLGQV